MENTQSPARVSGAVLILSFCAAIGIIAAIFYTGYLGIFLGLFTFALAMATRMPETQRDRVIVYSLAIASIGLGISGLALGVVARVLGYWIHN